MIVSCGSHFIAYFNKIIWPIWRCDSLNVHVCTPQYQCSTMIKHHISIFITWVIVLPLGSQVVQTSQKPWYEFRQFLIIVSINGIYHQMNIYIIKFKTIIISMNNMIILFDLWLIVIILRFSNKIYNIKFVINSMYVSVFWQGFKFYVIGFIYLINDCIKM